MQHSHNYVHVKKNIYWTKQTGASQTKQTSMLRPLHKNPFFPVVESCIYQKHYWSLSTYSMLPFYLKHNTLFSPTAASIEVLNNLFYREESMWERSVQPKRVEWSILSFQYRNGQL